MAEKHADAYMKQFAEQMWMQLGMRVFILTAHKDTLGAIDIAEFVWSYSVFMFGTDIYLQPWLQWWFRRKSFCRCPSEVGGEADPRRVVKIYRSGVWYGVAAIFIVHYWFHFVDPDNEKQSSDEETTTRKRKKVPVRLETADDGSPVLPPSVADGTMTYDRLHPILREYLNCHYH